MLGGTVRDRGEVLIAPVQLARDSSTGLPPGVREGKSPVRPWMAAQCSGSNALRPQPLVHRA